MTPQARSEKLKNARKAKNRGVKLAKPTPRPAYPMNTEMKSFLAKAKAETSHLNQ